MAYHFNQAGCPFHPSQGPYQSLVIGHPRTAYHRAASRQRFDPHLILIYTRI